MSFLEKMFCGNKIAEIERLKERVSQLNADKEILTRNYFNKIQEYNDMVQLFTTDKLELLQQIRNLNSILASSIILPDISNDVASPVEYNAFDNPINIPLGIIADETYYAFTLNQWKDALTKIQAVVKKTLKKWKPDISDCDDWALVLNGFAVTAFVKANLDHQGALLFARSRTHAYNIFVAVESTGFVPYIYEPQNNSVVGKLDEVDYEPYVTIKGWLLGSELPPF